MRREEWKRVEAVVDQLLDLTGADRQGLLDAVGARDPELRGQVEAFLAADAAAQQRSDVPTAARAALILEALREQEQALDASLEGTRVGPYRLLRQIGRGGMGVVFLAARADGEFEQQVALKLVRGGLDKAEILGRFKAERQILARLQHANIARLLDGGVSDDGQPYFAMEYVEGTPLTVFSDEARLPVRERVRLFLQVCGAVEYAHQNLVVHRDLKPSNILVTPAGEAKLLDFGIAKVLDPSGEDGAAPTRGEARVLTPEYAAPEQLAGGPITTATDAYSLGVVLYELLTGRHPKRLDPEPPSRDVRRRAPELARGLRGDLDRVVLMALRPEPSQRYPSAAALSRDLERALDGRPVSARPDTLLYRASRFARRNRLGVAAASLAALSLVGGVLGTLWQARRALEQARRADEVKRFALTLFEPSDPDAARGRDISAREILARGAERIQSELAAEPSVQAEMLLFVGNLYHRLGRDGESRPLLERALALRRDLFGADHLAVAEVDLALGGVHFTQGEWPRARELFEHALATRVRALGPAHPETAAVRAKLGRIAFERGELDAAESLLRQALADQRPVARAADPDVAVSLNALGRVLHAKGDVSGAERLYREALEMRRTLFGDAHTRVSESLLNLATALKDKGDLAGAEQSYRQVLAADRRVLGEEHEGVATHLNNLAALLVVTGRCVEAEQRLREGLALRRRNHGAGSPQEAVTLHHLGRALRCQGRLQEAESHSRRALTLAAGRLGEEHPNVAAVRDALAQTLGDERRLPEAEALARHALATYRSRLAADHPRVAEAQVTLGHVLVAAGRPAEAKPHLEQAVQLRRQVFGEDDWRTAEARLELGECLLALGSRVESEAHLTAAHRILAARLGPRHGLTLRAQAAAGGRPADAVARRPDTPAR